MLPTSLFTHISTSFAKTKFTSYILRTRSRFSAIGFFLLHNIKNMDRGKIVAILTGAISIAIAVAYLILVQILDSRGAMIPAPINFIYPWF